MIPPGRRPPRPSPAAARPWPPWQPPTTSPPCPTTPPCTSAQRRCSCSTWPPCWTPSSPTTRTGSLTSPSASSAASAPLSPRPPWPRWASLPPCCRAAPRAAAAVCLQMHACCCSLRPCARAHAFRPAPSPPRFMPRSPPARAETQHHRDRRSRPCSCVLACPAAPALPRQTPSLLPELFTALDARGAVFLEGASPAAIEDFCRSVISAEETEDNFYVYVSQGRIAACCHGPPTCPTQPASGTWVPPHHPSPAADLPHPRQYPLPYSPGCRYDLAVVEHLSRAWTRAMPRVQPCYAVK